jgi:uridine kinase
MKIITVSGASGSGKSTLATHIHNLVPDSLLLSLDRYYLSKIEQIEKNGFSNFDDPAAIDSDLLKESL